jgi:hypothetical protein
MGLFDFFKGPKTRLYVGEPIERALRPWLSENYEGRHDISPDGRYHHAWVKLEPGAKNRVNVTTFDGEKVGYVTPEMPECAELVTIVINGGVRFGTVKCFADEDRGRDGHGAILTLGPHRYQPKPPFKRIEKVDVRFE